MAKNLYYQTMFRRRNALGEALVNLFMNLASWPRCVLEVFIRKNFGERYFSFSTCIVLFFILLGLPPFIETFQAFGNYRSDITFWTIVWRNLTWYLYDVGFLIMAIKRSREIENLPSVFDFARFSLSTGLINPRFYDFKIGGKTLNVRKIETLLEPGFFFAIGLVLVFMGQRLGGLLIFCSILYSLSYVAAYNKGDHFIMDKIDEMICNEELSNSFVDGREVSETRGVNAYGRRPTDPDMRRKVVEQFIEQDDFSDVS